ncbi:MAG: membrane dipeptidase [bacterium]|nr:membrane dipeptidase [bacterium]
MAQVLRFVALTLLCSGCLQSGAELGLEERALRLHHDAIVVDTHSDTTPYFEDPTWDFGARHEASETHMDLPRMREGGLDVEFWSIYMGKRDGDGRAIREALERIDAVWQMAARHPEVEVATTSAEIRRYAAEGKTVSLMGVEGGHIIENKLSALRMFHRLGARYMTLTHSFHTDWADSSGTTSVPEPRHGGLSLFGEQVVREMNQLGMMIDVSHVSDETFWDVMRVSLAPVIASHSSCRAVFDHPRNMDDSMLKKLAETGGVIMINFYPSYIDAQANIETKAYFEKWGGALKKMREQYESDLPRLRSARRKFFAAKPVPQTSMGVLLDHFDHALRVAGPDHVGIGADWDGVPSMPKGMEEVTALPLLTQGLLERGHSEATVRKVLGENLLRVMSRIEAVAARLSQP